jgi:hypothetical protein
MPAGSEGRRASPPAWPGARGPGGPPRHAQPRAPSTPTARAAAGLTHPADGHERCLGPVSGMHRTRAGARLATLPTAARGTHGPHCGLSSGRFFEVLGQCVSAGGVERLAGCAGGAGDRRPQSIMLCRGFSAAPIRWPTWYPLPEVQLLTRRHSRQPSPRRPSDRCPAVALFPPLVTASNTATLPPAAGRCTAHGEDQARPAPPALAEGPARWHATPAPAQR